MKRLFATVFLVALLAPAVAHAGTIGIGAFGGASIPVVQDDAKQGSIFGVRVPVHLVPLLMVEPYYAKSGLGDVEDTFAGLSYTRDGFDVSSYGANVMLSLGGPLQFYPFVGIGQNTVKREGSDDQTLTGYNFGLGFGITPAPKLHVHLRGELQAIVDGDASRKFGNVTAGLSYDLINLP